MIDGVYFSKTYKVSKYFWGKNSWVKVNETRILSPADHVIMNSAGQLGISGKYSYLWLTSSCDIGENILIKIVFTAEDKVIDQFKIDFSNTYDLLTDRVYALYSFSMKYKPIAEKALTKLLIKAEQDEVKLALEEL